MAIYRETFTTDLSSASVSETRGFNEDVTLAEVMVHASENITETIKVLFDSTNGSNYDTELDSTDLSAADDYVFRPTGRCIFKKGDAVKVTITNANTTGIVYGTILTETA